VTGAFLTRAQWILGQFTEF